MTDHIETLKSVRDALTATHSPARTAALNAAIKALQAQRDAIVAEVDRVNGSVVEVSPVDAPSLLRLEVQQGRRVLILPGVRS